MVFLEKNIQFVSIQSIDNDLAEREAHEYLVDNHDSKNERRCYEEVRQIDTTRDQCSCGHSNQT